MVLWVTFWALESERHPRAVEEACQPAGVVGIGQGALARVGDPCVGDALRRQAVVGVHVGAAHVAAHTDELFALVEGEAFFALDAQQAEARAQRDLQALESDAADKLDEGLRRQELRVFLYRLALTLPLLVAAGWLFARQRKSTWWPFVWGFVFFGLFAFFVELVPYLPDYGGYVRYMVGIVVTVVVGRQAILALNRYLERQKLAEARPDVERRQELAYDVALAPHCPLGPIALAACLQVDAVSYNAFIQEQSLGIHYNTTNDLLDYLVDPSVFAYRDGHVAIPQGPGLGIEVDEAVVAKAAEAGHRWRNPVWRHADGSLAEW